MDQYRSYKRIHKYDSPSDVEKGKISRERHRFLKAERSAEAVIDRVIQSAIVGSEEYDELMADVDEHMTAYRKEKRNRQAHKARLKALQEREGFEQ